VIVKICGLTNREDAVVASEAGADLLGFVFAAGSRRRVGTQDCGWIRALAGPRKVGVFRDQGREEIAAIRDAAGLDLVQLHGSETPDLCRELGGRSRVIKALAVGSSVAWDVVAAYEGQACILFDTATVDGGGCGTVFDWSLLTRRSTVEECLLAGGLTPENVAQAIAAARPGGVDVASGVETVPGRKDPEKLRRFIAAAREAGSRGEGRGERGEKR
jgi:phosphoribosylanthranilate isomerase